MKLDALFSATQSIFAHFQQHAVKAVNMHLTLRNWLVGYYIVEYGQNSLLVDLSGKIGIKAWGRQT